MKDVISFTENISSLISSGLSLSDSLKVCIDIDSNKENKKLYEDIRNKIVLGMTFSSCLEEYPKYFSSLYVSMIKIGEKSGDITKVMQRLVAYLKQKKETKQKIKASLSYPLIVFVTSFIVIGIIIFYVLPKLKVIFEAFEENSSDIMNAAGDLKNLIIGLFCFVFLTAAVIISCIIIHRKSERGAYLIDKFLISVPLLKEYIKITNTSEFSFAMQLMCLSGFQIIEALEESAKVVKNHFYKSEVQQVRLDTINGMLISDSILQKKSFPKYVSTWISIGEMTGSVENVFFQIHDYYKKESTRLIEKLISNCEPIFILITGVFILLVISKFVLPVFSLLGDL